MEYTKKTAMEAQAFRTMVKMDELRRETNRNDAVKQDDNGRQASKLTYLPESVHLFRTRQLAKTSR